MPNASAPMALCFLARAGYAGGFSPGRTFGPVVSGPVRVGVGEIRAVVRADPLTGVGVGFGSARPLVQAATKPAISTIARNRIRTPRSCQTRDPPETGCGRPNGSAPGP